MIPNSPCELGPDVKAGSKLEGRPCSCQQPTVPLLVKIKTAFDAFAPWPWHCAWSHWHRDDPQHLHLDFLFVASLLRALVTLSSTISQHQIHHIMQYVAIVSIRSFLLEINLISTAGRFWRRPSSCIKLLLHSYSPPLLNADHSCHPAFPTPLPFSNMSTRTISSYHSPRRKLVLVFDVGTTYSGTYQQVLLTIPLLGGTRMPGRPQVIRNLERLKTPLLKEVPVLLTIPMLGATRMLRRH